MEMKKKKDAKIFFSIIKIVQRFMHCMETDPINGYVNEIKMNKRILFFLWALGGRC